MPAQGVQAGKAKRFQWATRDFQAVLRRLPALESSTADCNDLGGSGPCGEGLFPLASCILGCSDSLAGISRSFFGGRTFCQPYTKLFL